MAEQALPVSGLGRGLLGVVRRADGQGGPRQVAEESPGEPREGRRVAGDPGDGQDVEPRDQVPRQRVAGADRGRRDEQHHRQSGPPVASVVGIQPPVDASIQHGDDGHADREAGQQV